MKKKKTKKKKHSWDGGGHAPRIPRLKLLGSNSCLVTTLVFMFLVFEASFWHYQMASKLLSKCKFLEKFPGKSQ